MNDPALSFVIIFALVGAHQLYETVSALHTRRARRITFRKRYVALTEDSADYWVATAYHGFAALFSIGVAVILLSHLESK